MNTYTAYPLRDWSEFKTLYKSDIRMSIDWDRLYPCEIGFKVADKDTVFHLVNYKNGDWREGEPIKIKQSDNSKFAFVRIPAAEIAENKYLVLDGNHRLREMSPQFVVIDYLKVPQKKKKFITDFYNEENL